MKWPWTKTKKVKPACRSCGGLTMENVHLSTNESTRFVDVMSNPPEPTSTLKHAMALLSPRRKGMK